MAHQGHSGHSVPGAWGGVWEVPGKFRTGGEGAPGDVGGGGGGSGGWGEGMGKQREEDGA